MLLTICEPAFVGCSVWLIFNTITMLLVLDVFTLVAYAITKDQYTATRFVVFVLLVWRLLSNRLLMLKI